MAKKKVKKKKVKAEKVARNPKISKEELEEKNKFSKTVLTLIAITIAIFVAIALFMDTGTVGAFVKTIVTSFFGTLGYVFPVVLLLAVLIAYLSNEKVVAIKIYSLIILYVMVICFFETSYNDFSAETNYFDVINESISKAKLGFSLKQSLFSGGILGTGISYITVKALGQAGSILLFGLVTLITFLIIFGLGVVNILRKVLLPIIMFIPNQIRNEKNKLAEDAKIAIDNENLLNKTYEKSKMTNLGLTLENDYDGKRKVLEPITEHKFEKKYTYDTSHIKITSDDIQSKFYNVEEHDISEEERRDKNRLLNELKKKSINEVKYENPTIKSNSFFYTDGMKPINELEKVVFPEPKSQTTIFDSNQIDDGPINDYEDDNKNDNENFASGLDDLQDESETLDYKNMSNHDILLNDKKDIELKNPADSSYAIDTDKSTSTNQVLVRKKKRPKKYRFPQLSFLNRSAKTSGKIDPSLNEKADILIETLKQFGVGAKVTNITVGPSVTRFELKPDLGVKVAKILSLEDDVKLALAASEIRIEAPIPGKSAIGIEIANTESSGVSLGDIIATPEFRNSESKLTVAIGKDIQGKPIVADLRKMPHVLIAGATGSGKSVCINSLITSLIYKSSPEDVRLIMVDPKVVELQIYDGIPHLLIPVVTNPKKAASALNWAVSEMTRRYNLIQEKRVRDIESYNQAIQGEINKLTVNDNNEATTEEVQKLPYIVIIIDEFADLMMVASKEVENAIMRIAQLARACGIYLVIATQRPSVNVISGSIKTNVPSRISFAVASGVDSQTILDRRGAEKLLGHGDMLYFPQGIPEPKRVQGCYVSEEEILKVVDYVKDDESAIYDENAEMMIEKGASGDTGSSYDPNEKDDLFIDAGKLVIEQQNASIGMLQRRFRIGFNRAARIIDQLEANSVVSKQDGKKAREVLMSDSEFNEKFGG